MQMSSIPPNLPFVGANEFLARKIEEPPWLIKDIWPADGCGFISGWPKSGKSFVALDFALAVASGGRFLGFPVEYPGEVLLVDAETPALQLQDRLRRLSAGRQLSDNQLAQLSLLSRYRLQLDRGEHYNQLCLEIDLRRPRLVIIDPMVRYHSLDENSAQEMSFFLNGLRDLVAGVGGSLVVVHHWSKSGAVGGRRPGTALRGSGDLHGWYDAAIFVKRVTTKLTLSFECRYCADREPIHAVLDIDEESARIAVPGSPEPPGRVVASSERILALLSETPAGLSKKQLREALKVSGARINDLIEPLLQAREVHIRRGRRGAEIVTPGCVEVDSGCGQTTSLTMSTDVVAKVVTSNTEYPNEPRTP